MPLKKSWHDYNESLIERGRILMDISFLGSSKKEIKNMNKGKVGAAFEYSHTYIQFLAFLKIGFKIAYRTVQGIIRGLSDYIKIEEIHFTQIRRILKVKPSVGNLNLDNDDDNKPITLIVDASGLTITKKGDYYIEQKWIRKKKRVYQTTYCSRCKIKEGSFIQSN
ncbi:MAG TPA: transposase [Nitrososphaeraceae archaeon]|nr:transposase [Nitrososphaeraceae archaeon]